MAERSGEAASKWQACEEAERHFENSIATRYNRDYYGAPLMQWHAAGFARYVARFYRAGDRVLDLGCGPASLWPFWVAELTSPGALVGVDLSEGMVAEARRRHPTGTFQVGSFFEIPFPAGSFDVVIVSSALHHLPDDSLPDALREIARVLDEHGVLVGREPLRTERIVDKGPWLSGTLMHLRHLAYRLTHTREYPEPSPTDAHHAYDAEQFLTALGAILTTTSVEFHHPVSPLLARARHPAVVAIAKLLDEKLQHRMGQELYYSARKNFSTAEDVARCVQLALAENRIQPDLQAFLALVDASARFLEGHLADGSVERAIDPSTIRSGLPPG